MKTQRILLAVSDEQKYAYAESAHEARMSLSEWMRFILDSASEAQIAPKPTHSIRPAVKEPVAISLASLKDSLKLVTGDELVCAVPKWAADDSDKVAEARKKLFGMNPDRRLSQLESDFNKLAVLEWQKFSSSGKPMYDAFENPIEY